MCPHVEIEFAGQTRSVELQDVSETTWQRICHCAEAISGLKQCAIRYEDESGDLCKLSLDTLEDLMWIAEGSPTRVKLVVRQDEDQRLDELHTVLLQHLGKSLDRKPPTTTLEQACSSSSEVSETSKKPGVRKQSRQEPVVVELVMKALTKMKRNLDVLFGWKQQPLSECEKVAAIRRVPWERVVLPLAIAIWQSCCGDFSFFLGAFSVALVYCTYLVACAKAPLNQVIRNKLE